jgi:hypothetical protein
VSVRLAVAVVVLALSLLRLYSLVRSDRWIWQNGPTFAAESRKLTAAITPAEREALYLKHGGGFFPFGIKGFRLAMWARRLTGVRRVLFRRPLLLARWVWSFYWFCPLVSLYLIGVSGDRHASEVEKWVQAATAYLVIVWALLICAEAILAYVRLRSWGALYHGLSYQDTSKNGGGLTEFKVTFGAALMTVIGTWAAFDFIAGRLGGITPMRHEPFLPRLGDALYWAISTLIQSAAPAASTAPARVAVEVATITGEVFLLAVVGLTVGFLASVAPTEAGGHGQPTPVSESDTASSAKAGTRWHRGTALLGGVAAAGLVVRHFLLRRRGS